MQNHARRPEPDQSEDRPWSETNSNAKTHTAPSILGRSEILPQKAGLNWAAGVFTCWKSFCSVLSLPNCWPHPHPLAQRGSSKLCGSMQGSAPEDGAKFECASTCIAVRRLAAAQGSRIEMQTAFGWTASYRAQFHSPSLYPCVWAVEPTIPKLSHMFVHSHAACYYVLHTVL